MTLEWHRKKAYLSKTTKQKTPTRWNNLRNKNIAEKINPPENDKKENKCQGKIPLLSIGYTGYNSWFCFVLSVNNIKTPNAVLQRPSLEINKLFWGREGISKFVYW